MAGTGNVPHHRCGYFSCFSHPVNFATKKKEIDEEMLFSTALWWRSSPLRRAADCISVFVGCVLPDSPCFAQLKESAECSSVALAWGGNIWSLWVKPAVMQKPFWSLLICFTEAEMHRVWCSGQTRVTNETFVFSSFSSWIFISNTFDYIISIRKSY